MGINTTKIFISTACDILKGVSLSMEDQESLCDELMVLVGKYAPNNGKLVNNDTTVSPINDEDY
jgi:hypothetical protein